MPKNLALLSAIELKPIASVAAATVRLTTFTLLVATFAAGLPACDKGVSNSAATTQSSRTSSFDPSKSSETGDTTRAGYESEASSLLAFIRDNTEVTLIDPPQNRPDTGRDLPYTAISYQFKRINSSLNDDDKKKESWATINLLMHQLDVMNDNWNRQTPASNDKLMSSNNIFLGSLHKAEEQVSRGL